MGLHAHVSSLRVRAQASGDDQFVGLHGRFVPPEWIGSLSAAGIYVTPELAMTLGAFYSAVKTIARDLGTLPAQTFKYRTDGGKERVMPRSARATDDFGGIGRLAYLLRHQPNLVQTAPEFWMSMLASFAMRGRGYAEIKEGGARGAIGQLLPRHPDRVTPQRLPSGELRYRLIEADGKPRYVDQEWMFAVTDMSLDGGMTPAAVTTYGAQSIGAALAVQQAAGRFFKGGMTASTLVTYKGERMEDEEEADLHKSISRYATGLNNAFGLLLVPDSIDVKNLTIDPEKAQMMLAQEWGVREVARYFNMPGHKLGIKDSVAYNSQVQSALEYVVSCLRPISVIFESAIQRDLIIAKDTYVVEFLLAALMRGDFETQANYIEKLIQNRVIWPSEARAILNMNEDKELDELSKRDRQPGRASNEGRDRGSRDDRDDRDRRGAVVPFSKGGLRAILAVHDNALRCQRRERAAIEKLAKKHANDVDGWKVGLRDFFADHAAFIAQTMRVPIDQAREYAAHHGEQLDAKGLVVHTDEWEREEADALAFLAVGEGEVAA